MSLTIVGLEFGTECWGGNSINNPGINTWLPDASCSMACSGNPAGECGAATRLKIYSYYSPPAPTFSAPSSSPSTLLSSSRPRSSSSPVQTSSPASSSLVQSSSPMPLPSLSPSPPGMSSSTASESSSASASSPGSSTVSPDSNVSSIAISSSPARSLTQPQSSSPGFSYPIGPIGSSILYEFIGLYRIHQ